MYITTIIIFEQLTLRPPTQQVADDGCMQIDEYRTPHFILFGLMVAYSKLEANNVGGVINNADSRVTAG